MQNLPDPVDPVNSSSCRLTASDLKKIAALVYAKSGIALRDGKGALVIARLQKRLRQGGFSSFADYLSFIERDRSGAELTAVLDAITTNHTSFFREIDHFQVLCDVLRGLLARSGTRPITGWSAACATGEEAYSIFMTLLDHTPAPHHGRLRLLASDLSTLAIRTARAGIYGLDRVAELPRTTLERYFERGLGEQEGLVRVKRELRGLVEFRRLNLMDIQTLGITFDFIFCRNAMIYFDRAARQRVVSMLERHLTPDGTLFVSHSEGLSEIDHQLRWCGPGVYRRRGA
jgi:chemotaxis protein methyltransferase CheR